MHEAGVKRGVAIGDRGPIKRCSGGLAIFGQALTPRGIGKQRLDSLREYADLPGGHECNALAALQWPEGALELR